MNPSTVLQTKYGDFTITYHGDETNHAVTMQKGDISQSEPLVRIHSSCLFSESLEAVDCDCKLQLGAAIQQIAQYGRGIIVYLYQEGRGVGLANKIRAVATMHEDQCDTVDAFQKLGFPLDPRSYDLAIQALAAQNTARTIRLMSNNPRKHQALIDAGYTINEKIDLSYHANPITAAYLQSKQEKLGHDIPWSAITVT